MGDIAVIGPGAIGCAFAAAALQAGHAVSIAARTRFAALDVTYPGGRVQGAVRALSLGETKPFPVVMLATKAHQTAEAAPWLAALCRQGTMLAVLQNGVEHIARVQPLVPSGVEIVPAMVACPSDRVSPGVAHVTGPARLDVPPGEASVRFQCVFDGSFAEVRIVDDWLTSAWGKLVLNAVGGGIGVLTRRGNEVLQDEGIARLYRALAAEVAAVARAEGAKLPDDIGERLYAMISRGPHLHMGSIVVDRLNGRATEW
ncbi:MAG: 2-dehydropantoate 2-reductase N-terminal domain-containing protein, partial [Micropepsaceae bacterium]